MLEELKRNAEIIAEELVEKAKLKKGQVVVVGCSSSEVIGSKIGTNSSPEIADEIFKGLYEVFRKYGIYMAAQCCERGGCGGIFNERQSFGYAAPYRYRSYLP